MIKNINRYASCRVLELEEPVSREEIKRTYRRLVKEWHPDRNPGDPFAEERFKEIQQAYDFLINEKTDPEQNRENHRGSDIYTAMQDHPMQSFREMAVRYYAEKGWFKNNPDKKT